MPAAGLLAQTVIIGCSGWKVAVPLLLLVALEQTNPLAHQNGTVSLSVHRVSWTAPVTM